jgi:hypothetical protein
MLLDSVSVEVTMDCRWGRVKVEFRTASCNAMNTEHILKQRIDVPSGGGVVIQQRAAAL